MFADKRKALGCFTCPEENGIRGKGNQISWWETYTDEQIIAWDSEHVSSLMGVKFNGKLACQNLAATVEAIDAHYNSVLRKRIYHATGSFKVDVISKSVNGFTKDEFNNPLLPSFEEVRAEAHNLFLKQGLVVTCGGENDYQALKLDKTKYDTFHLQDHWFYYKDNTDGSKSRVPHSLRSLDKYYLDEDVQGGPHSALEDAVTTMRLFEVYKRIKLVDDASNVDKRVNYVRSYDEIPVVPNPIKLKFGGKEKQNRKKRPPRFS